MNDLKKITINGVTYDVTPGSHLEDKNNPHGVTAENLGITIDNLMVKKLAGKRIVMLGDSNAAGSGWYSAVAGGVKNETNDGVFAVLREMLPETTFKNYAVGGAGFVQGTNIMQQIEDIEGTPDIIFVWAGGNDISAYVGGSSAVILNAPNMQDYDLEAFDNSLYGKVNQTLYTLRQRYPFAKICGVIRTYKLNADLASQRNIYGTISRLYQKYQCSVINLNDFSNVVDYITEQADYWKDAIHYSEYCFRHLLAPIFYAAICNNLNVNTYIPVDTMYTNETANNLANPLALAFQVGMNKSTCVTLHNYPKRNFSVFAGGRFDAANAAAFRLPTLSNNVEFYREKSGTTYSCRMDHTEDMAEGVDVATLDHGRYVFTSYVGPECTGIPEGLSGAFMIDITVTPSGAKYAQLHYWGGNSLWVGVMSGSDSAFTWKKVTA